MRVSMWRLVAVGICLAAVACSNKPASRPGIAADDPKPIDGLWLGSWGGGVGADGVVFQPAVAELLVEADRVELYGFPDADSLAGSIRVDASGQRLTIVPDAAAGGQPPPPIEYAYALDGDTLTLTGLGPGPGGEKHSLTFERRGAIEPPLADARVELVAAAGINDAGELLVAEVTELRAGRAGTTYFHSAERSLKTRRATVFHVQDTGAKKITVDEARAMLRPNTLVAVTYRDDARAPSQQVHQLWKELGPPPPDGDAVAQTLVTTLRPGTLVFVLSAQENVPQP